MVDLFMLLSGQLNAFESISYLPTCIMKQFSYVVIHGKVENLPAVLYQAQCLVDQVFSAVPVGVLESVIQY